MNACEEQYKWLSATNTVRSSPRSSKPRHHSTLQFISRRHEGDKVVVFERGEHGLLFIFNFHTSKSFADYRIGVGRCGKYARRRFALRHPTAPLFRYKVVLNSDSKSFDGLGRISDQQVFLTEDVKWDERPFSFKVYTPCRTVLVLALSGDVK